MATTDIPSEPLYPTPGSSPETKLEELEVLHHQFSPTLDETKQPLTICGNHGLALPSPPPSPFPSTSSVTSDSSDTLSIPSSVAAADPVPMPLLEAEPALPILAPAELQAQRPPPPAKPVRKQSQHSDIAKSAIMSRMPAPPSKDTLAPGSTSAAHSRTSSNASSNADGAADGKGGAMKGVFGTTPIATAPNSPRM
jgi:hypothetical protein